MARKKIKGSENPDDDIIIIHFQTIDEKWHFKICTRSTAERLAEKLEDSDSVITVEIPMLLNFKK